MNSLLVIVVTYNAMPWAERCFDSLKHSSIPNDIFVIDNGSTDGTQAYVRQNIPSAIFVQSEKFNSPHFSDNRIDSPFFGQYALHV